MHIALLADGYPSQGRPSFVFVQQLVHAMLKQGVKVTVVAPQSLTHSLIHKQGLLPKKSKVKLENDIEYDVYRPYCISFGNNGKKLANLVKWYNQNNIDRALQSIAPTVLYGHFWHNGNMLTKYAIRNKTPLFVACGEGDDAMENLVASLSEESISRLKRTVKGVISVSSENKRKCINYGLSDSDNVVVLPNCADDDLFHPAEEEKRKEIRSKIGLKKDDFFILFVGGFVPRKGANRVSSAIELLDDANIKSAFIGKSYGIKEAEPYGKGVIFQGTLDHDAVPDYYQASDVFVLPTLNEGCSNAIIEALASGVPVISSNRPFNADILNSHNSIQVNPESVEELRIAILAMVQDKSMYNSLKQYAVLHSSCFSIKERAKKIIDFINEQLR